MGKKISVIVPTYNPDINKLNRSIGSILASTYINFELLIIDDGSEEKYQDSIEMLSQMDSRIKISHQNNSGVSKARNTGIRISKGDYLAFIDDDDIVSPLFLEEAISVAEREDCDLVIGGVLHQEETTLPTEELHKEMTHYDILIGEKCREFRFEMLGVVKRISNGGYISRGPVARLIRKDVCDVYFPEDIVYGEDNIWNILLLSKIKKLAIVDRIWYIYITNPNSVSRKCCFEAVEQGEKLINQVSSLLCLDNIERIKEYGDYIFFELNEALIRWFCR